MSVVRISTLLHLKLCGMFALLGFGLSGRQHDYVALRQCILVLSVVRTALTVAVWLGCFLTESVTAFTLRCGTCVPFVNLIMPDAITLLLLYVI